MTDDSRDDGIDPAGSYPEPSPDGTRRARSRPRREPETDIEDQEAEEATPQGLAKPLIIPRPDHEISRKDIDPDAVRILYRLHRNGYKAYLVGGGVRDLMLGRKPKDFDIATDARPRRLQRMFRNCRVIGRRFRLAHLHYPGDKIIEVATFRSSPENDAIIRDGELIQRDNVFGTPAEDARRRDLTINGLFYSIADFSVIDYVGGVSDLRKGVVRTICDPVQSFREDPVRMLRTIRHATRLGFHIAQETRDALGSELAEILKANSARLLEELYKDLSSGNARPHCETLHDYRFLKTLVPDLVSSFRKRGTRAGKALFLESLDRLDELTRQGVEVTHAIGLAAFFAPIILPVARDLVANGSGDQSAAEVFQDALEGAFQNIRVYRKDADRLWHILGAWPKIAKAFEKDSIPQALYCRHYFAELVEVYGLLEDITHEREEFLTEAREIVPPPEEREPAESRSRGRSPGRSSSATKKRSKKGRGGKFRRRGPRSQGS